MCKIEQCYRCRLDSYECGHYDHTDPTPCVYFIKPIDNTKMFARWYKFSGRIGRLEYVLTLVGAVAIYIGVILWSGFIMGALGPEEPSGAGAYLVTLLCMLPSAYIAIAAGVKRAHDTNVSSWYSLTPLLPLFLLNIFTILAFVVGCIYLFKEAGEEGVNEHGSNPVQPYDEQLHFEEIA